MEDKLAKRVHGFALLQIDQWRKASTVAYHFYLL